MYMNISTFSERLKKSRKSKNITQAELSKLSGVTSATISAYESADNNKGCNPSLANAIKLANSLNVSLDWLCGTTSNKSDIGITDFLKTLVKLREKTNISIDSIDIAKDEHNYLVPNAFREVIDQEYINSNCGEIYTYPVSFIAFGNRHIERFLNEWQKMYELYKNKTIDESLYNLWLDKQFKDIDEDIKDIDEEYEDDLPF